MDVSNLLLRDVMTKGLRESGSGSDGVERRGIGRTVKFHGNHPGVSRERKEQQG
jgi:hypothetical protein